MVDTTPAPGYVTVMEASRRLGVTPERVRHLIRTNDLAAERLGRAYMVSIDAIERRSALAPASGRRLTPAHAWGVIALAGGDPTPWLDRSTRSRLRHLLGLRGLRNLRARLTDRARPHRLRGHPSLLRDLRADPSLMLSGAPAASRLHLGLTGGEAVDGYLGIGDLEHLVEQYHLRPSRDPNVILRVVPFFSAVWPRPAVAPLAAVILDLLDDMDPRARQVGEEQLIKLDP